MAREPWSRRPELDMKLPFEVGDEAIRLFSDKSRTMDTSTPTVSPLRQRMLDDMRIRIGCVTGRSP